jgi:hypothetical protein
LPLLILLLGLPLPVIGLLLRLLLQLLGTAINTSAAAVVGIIASIFRAETVKMETVCSSKTLVLPTSPPTQNINTKSFTAVRTSCLINSMTHCKLEAEGLGFADNVPEG